MCGESSGRYVAARGRLALAVAATQQWVSHMQRELFLMFQ